MLSSRARLGVAVMAFAATAFTIAPASAQEVEPAVALEHTVAFDKSEYRSGDSVTITLTLTNTGDAPITVHGFAYDDEPGDIALDWKTWGPLSGDGLALAAGTTHMQELRGWVGDPDATVARFRGLFTVNGDTTVDFSVEAPVTVVHGGVSGVAYYDVNGNRQVDDGELAKNASVSLRSRAGDQRSATTDGSGAFAFTGLAPVPHYLSVTRHDGWEFEFQTVQVVADEDVAVTVPGVRPFKDSLKVDMRFTEDAYQVGDTARIDVTLTNTGTIPLAGIRAYCNRSGEGPQLDTGPGWGELLHSSAGVSLAAGQTKRLTVTETIPERVRAYGSVFVFCDFGFEGSTNPSADDWAKIPGTVGSITTRTYHDRNGNNQVDSGEAVGGVDVRLTDHETGAAVVTRRAGGDGVAKFTDVPAGRYGLDVSGPWDVVADQGYFVVKSDGCWYTCDYDVKVVPGKDQPPTTSPAAPTTTAPAPAPRPAPPGSLPDTGADVRWLFGLGVLTVLAGAALMLVRRRRA